MNAPTVDVRTRGTTLLFVALALPIVAWAGHLTATAALVDESCTHDAVTWLMHGLTAGTALVCIACGLVGVAAVRRPAGHGDGNGARRFLGVLVIAVAITNLVLIVWEGSYTQFLSSCR